MKWEKKELEEIEDVIQNLNKIKHFAKDKLQSAKEKIDFINKEMPEYVEIYKKMKEL